MIRDKKIPEYGLRNTEVLAYLRELGHYEIQQSSVTAGLIYLPKLLRKNNIPSIFDYDGTYFYLLDNYMKFVLRWVPELIDDLFDSESDFDCDSYDSDVEIKLESYFKSLEIVNGAFSEFSDSVNVFTHMIITSEDPKAKTAEVQHPVFGKRNISEHDEELIKIVAELKRNDVILPMDTDVLFGFESFVVLFYLGFLYAKGHIGYNRLDEKSIQIYLTSEAKRKMNL
jgi:hypothetical protein